MIDDPFLLMEIDFEAAKRAADRAPPGPCRLIDIMNEDDYRHAIRRVFSEAEGFEEWMVSPLLKQFREAQEVQRRMEALAGEILGAIMPSFLGSAFGGPRSAFAW